MNRAEGAERLARARRLVAVQAAIGVVVGVLIVGAVTVVFVLNRQDADLSARLRATAAAADVRDPAEGVWIVTVDAQGRRTASDRAPIGLPTSDQVARARDDGVPVVEEVHAERTEYLTRTERHGSTVVQAGVDFGPRDAERTRLFLGLGIAGVLAAGAAVAVGGWFSRRAIAPLEEAMARQRRFVADASHELRTPLARLTLRAQMLERALRRAEERELDHEAALLVRDARHTAAIVEDLLLSAQLEQSPVQGELVDLGELAAGVVDADRIRGDERGVELRSTSIPTPPVRGVAVALARAVNALVDNALTHAPENGHVLVDVRPGSEGEVLLSVSDDGPGIPTGDRERLFERFARGHADHGRFGLGLALVREVVESHGGRVVVDPDYASGARFEVALPAAVVIEDEAP